jgi:crotonobetaine/carnitine-CoA ligase
MGPLSQHKEFARRFGCSVYTAYGMTEVPVPITSELDPDDEKSCGRAADPVHYELRLVDENDIPVPPNTPGELVARHTLPWTINSGYKNMPEATAEAWRNGWFHTGDQFTQDEQGNFYFLDRIKDVIRRRGENISSFEVEQAIADHPAVAAVAVFAVPSELAEDEVMAAIVLREGAKLDPVGLIRHLEPRLAHFAIPRYVEFVDELPLTENGKVRKVALRERGVTDRTWDREAAGYKLAR